MRAWFDNLNSRERLIVTIGAVAAVLIIAWGLVWKPLRENTTDLRTSVADKAELVVDLKRAAGLRGGVAQPTGPAPNQSLVVVIDETARPFGLARAFTRTRPDGPNAIDVQLQDAAFDSLIAWLALLEQQYAIRVESVQLSDARESGLVNGSLSLRRM